MTDHNTRPELSEALAAAQAEYERDGALSPATFDTLAGFGFGTEYVKGFIEGHRNALLSLYIGAMHDAAGGPDAFHSLLLWAAANTSPEQQAAYDADATSGEFARGPAAVRALRQQFATARGGA